MCSEYLLTPQDLHQIAPTIHVTLQETVKMNINLLQIALPCNEEDWRPNK